MSTSGATMKDKTLSRHWLGLNTHRVTQWLPGIISVMMLVVALYLLHRGLQGVQWSDVKDHLSTLGLVHVLLAFFLTVLSYLLLTLYDRLALSHVQFDLPWSKMAPTTFSAYAIGHNVGLAARSGGAVRYRAYTAAGLDATRIARVVFFCSATFFLGASLLLGIYLLYLAIAVVSNVPGGLGVFEGAMLLLLPSVPRAELLGSSLVYRVFYYLLPFLLALVLLVVQESMARRHQLNAVLNQGSLILTRAAPQIISITVFVAGAALLFSGSLPSDAARIRYITELVPDALVQASHMLGSVFGLMLLILARGLHRRLESAFWVALVVLLLGAVVSLAKGFDYEEATVLLLAAAVLWSGRREFHRRASLLDEPFNGGWLFGILMITSGAIWLGLFLERHVEYNNDLWWDFTVDHDAPRMLWANLAVVVGLLVFGLARLLRACLLSVGLPRKLISIKLRPPCLSVLRQRRAFR